MPRPKASRTETQLQAKDSFGMGDVRKVKAFRGEELDPTVPRSRIQTRTYLIVTALIVFRYFSVSACLV